MDSNADCTRLVVDGWLELELREPEEALKVLSTALTLRAEWERLLLTQLGHSTMGGAEGQGVPRKVMEKLSESLVRCLLYTEVLMQIDKPYLILWLATLLFTLVSSEVSFGLVNILCVLSLYFLPSLPGQLQPAATHGFPDSEPVHRPSARVRAVSDQTSRSKSAVSRSRGQAGPH